MANSVDPDQTAPEGAVCSGSALFAYNFVRRFVQNFRAFTVLIAPNKKGIQIYFLFHHENICCGYSLELSHQSNVRVPTICFRGEIRKTSILYFFS